MSDEKIIVATDIEDFNEVDVIEVLVSPGDSIELNQSIVTLESDKAMMEFPASDSGIVKSVAVNVGDKIKQGDPLLTINVTNVGDSEAESAAEERVNKQENKQIKERQEDASKEISQPEIDKKISTEKTEVKIDKAYASPAVRKYANELGVDLDRVVGTSKDGRISKADVQGHVQMHVSTERENRIEQTNYKLPNFSEFGEIKEVSLNKLRQVSAKHLHHAWKVAPHVTQFDEADITELEAVRKQLKEQVEAQGAKLTLLPFVMKALVKCLQEYPDFNSSLNHEVTKLIHKKYYNIGVAVDTPRGLVVPVLEAVDQKKILVIAKELMEISSLARENKLTPKNMQGGCITITSLGGIGGQHFTPIINFPEVAILGLSRTNKKLVKQNDKIIERLMLPLSLSYDHRAIDGVAAVKFTTSLKNKLSDVWSLMV